MAHPASERLRELVHDYYHGLLTFESYRQQRAQLLDGLDDAETEDDRTARRPRPARAAQREPRRDETRRARTLEGRPPSRNVLPRLIAAAVLLAVGGGLMLYQWHVLPSSDADRDLATVSPGVDAPAPSEAGERLLAQFLERNDWGLDALRNLEIAWTNALSDAQRDSTRLTTAYADFADALRRRIREEQALAGPTGSPELDALVTVAVELDMPYASSLRASMRLGARRSESARSGGMSNDAQASDAAADASAVAMDADAAGAEETTAEEAIPADASEPLLAPADDSAESALRAEADEATGDEPEPARASAGQVVAASPAREESAEASPGSRRSTCTAALLSTRAPFCADSLAIGGEGPVMVVLPAGEFVMGSDRMPEARPPRPVTIAAPFAMSMFEVSAAEFAVYCRDAGVRCPENSWGDDYPVVDVSFEEASAYAEWLSAQTGHRYRLPSEAEWEYAARAGTTSTYPFGEVVTPAAARSSENGRVDSPVGNSDRSVNRNPFQLYHMIGNVREWVADPWHPNHSEAPPDGRIRDGGDPARRAVRGGSYRDLAVRLRSAARVPLAVEHRDRETGFRVVRELDVDRAER